MRGGIAAGLLLVTSGLVGVHAEQKGDIRFRVPSAEQGFAPFCFPSEEDQNCLPVEASTEPTDETNATNAPTEQANLADLPTLQAVASEIKSGVSPRCPEQEEYQFLVTKDPNSQLCLVTDGVKIEAGDGQLVFEVKLNPAAGLLIDINKSLDGATKEECQEAINRMSEYGAFIINQTELMPDDKGVGVALLIGRRCGTFTPDPVIATGKRLPP